MHGRDSHSPLGVPQHHHPPSPPPRPGVARVATNCLLLLPTQPLRPQQHYGTPGGLASPKRSAVEASRRAQQVAAQQLVRWHLRLEHRLGHKRAVKSEGHPLRHLDLGQWLTAHRLGIVHLQKSPILSPHSQAHDTNTANISQHSSVSLQPESTHSNAAHTGEDTQPNSRGKKQPSNCQTGMQVCLHRLLRHDAVSAAAERGSGGRVPCSTTPCPQRRLNRWCPSRTQQGTHRPLRTHAAASQRSPARQTLLLRR